MRRAARLLAHDRQAVHEQRRDLHGLEVEQHLPRFHLRQVEDVVDQREQMLAAAQDVAGEVALLVAHRADEPVAQDLREADDRVERRAQLVRHVGEELRLHPARVLELRVLLLERLLEPLELRHVARRGEHPLQPAVAIVEGGRVVRDHGELAVPRARRELVVGHLSLGQHAVDPRLGAVGVGEVVPERSADQLVARAAGQRLRLLVHVGDDAARIGRHQRVDVRLDQRARVEVLVAQPLVEPHALVFHLLARGVVRADQQVADDGALRVAQRRHRDDGRESAAILPDVRQLVDVLDAARRLEHQRLEAWRDRRPELDAQRLGARDHLLRIGDRRGRDLVDDIGRRVAEHPFRPDVEDLDHSLRIRRDAREVRAVEDRALQRAGLEQRVLRVLARRVVGPDEQVADDGILRVAKRRDRDHGGKPASILPDVGQLVDVLDRARCLEHQRLETRRDGRAELETQRCRPSDDLLGIGDLRGRDLVDDVGGGVAQHALCADVEDLDHALGVGRDAGEVGAVEDRALERAGLQERRRATDVGGEHRFRVEGMSRDGHVCLLHCWLDRVRGATPNQR